MKSITRVLMSFAITAALAAGAYAESKGCCNGSSCCNGQSCCRQHAKKK